MIYDLSIMLAYPTGPASDSIDMVAEGQEIKRFLGPELLLILRECLEPGTYVRDGVEPVGMILTASWKDNPRPQNGNSA